MKKTTLALALVVFAIAGGSMLGAGAATCGSSTGRTATDPFGSCENTGGEVYCGTGTDVGPLATVIADPNKGVQACAADSDTFPIAGRITVYKDASNNVAVGVDGGDKKNSGGASAWQRYDVRPGEQKVCARRGTSGTWYDNTGSGKGTSNPDNVNQGAGASGRTTCQGAFVPA